LQLGPGISSVPNARNLEEYPMVLASKEGPVVSSMEEPHVTVALREVYTTIAHTISIWEKITRHISKTWALETDMTTQEESPA